MKRLPIGLSDYKQLIDSNFYYVDKTLFINDLLTQGGLVNLFPRPRRFGKTLNLSMLRYFFEKTEQSNAYLFQDKKIWQVEQARKLQGTFPVIFMTFKSVKESDWKMTYEKIVLLIAEEYRRHDYLLKDQSIRIQDRETFERIASRTASESDYNTSLLLLSKLLERYHNSRVIILIDEYDAPIHEAFLRGYYDKVTGFMRSFLGDGLKDNSSLELGIITGILRTAKEGIFSGLNNLKVFTILDPEINDKFGFTEEEITQFLLDYNLENIHDSFRAWYNGYLIGNTKIYNPWSSLGCIDKKGTFLPYWVNTSNNALIASIIATSQPDIKDACALLLEGKALPDIQIEDKMVLPGMMHDQNAIWSMFLFTGYLTVAAHRIEEGIQYVNLVIPNKELVILFNQLIQGLFQQGLNGSDIMYLESALRNADGQLFETLLSKFIMSSMSYHDIPEDEPEKSYHLFVLGLLVVLGNSYTVRSNRESGYGRYDIMLIPKDSSKVGLVIEFKKKDKTETLEQCADRALKQIIQKQYSVELHSLGIQQVVHFGVACHKKEILLKQS